MPRTRLARRRPSSRRRGTPPALFAISLTGAEDDPSALVHEAVRANVRASANHLRHGSEILENLIASDGLLVVDAEYSLATAIVDFFDGVPEDG